MIPNSRLVSLAFTDLVAENGDRDIFIEGRNFRFQSEGLERDKPVIILCGVRANAMDFSHLRSFKASRPFKGVLTLTHNATGQKVLVRIKG